MANVLAFLRTSTKLQNVEVQRHELTQFAHEQGHTIIDWIIMEGHSAYGGPPDAIELVVKKLEKGRFPERIDLFLFSDVDRFSRDLTEGMKLYHRIRALGIAMIFAREPQLNLDTPEGKHLFRTKLSQAELESDKISERVIAANIRKRFLGEPIGPSPFGFHTERGIRRQNPKEHAILIIIMMFYGNYTTGQLLDAIASYHRYYEPENIETGGYSIYYGTEKQPRDAIYYGTPEGFANFLNEFRIFKRGRPWTPAMVSYAYENYVLPQIDSLKLEGPLEQTVPDHYHAHDHYHAPDHYHADAAAGPDVEMTDFSLDVGLMEVDDI